MSEESNSSIEEDFPKKVQRPDISSIMSTPPTPVEVSQDSKSESLDISNLDREYTLSPYR